MEYLIDPKKKTYIEISSAYVVTAGYLAERREEDDHFTKTNKLTQVTFKIKIDFKQDDIVVFNMTAANSQPIYIVDFILSTFKKKNIFEELLTQNKKHIPSEAVKEILTKELEEFYLYFAKNILRTLKACPINTEFSDSKGNTQTIFLTPYTLPGYTKKIGGLNTLSRSRRATFNLLETKGLKVGVGKINAGSMSIQYLPIVPRGQIVCSLWDIFQIMKEQPSRGLLLNTIRDTMKFSILLDYSSVGIDLSASNCQMVRLEQLDHFAELDKTTQILLIKLIRRLGQPLLYLHFVDKNHLTEKEQDKIKSAINLIMEHGEYKIISDTPNIPTNASTQRHLLLSR